MIENGGGRTRDGGSGYCLRDRDDGVAVFVALVVQVTGTKANSCCNKEAVNNDLNIKRKKRTRVRGTGNGDSRLVTVVVIDAGSGPNNT
jgi:hypothetical protein